MAATEDWAPIPGFPGYAISDQGRVRSLKIWRGRPGPRFLTGTPEGSGYLQVSLMLDGRERKQAIHRLVALAFRGPRPLGMEVRHLDGDQRNNTLINLVYGTPMENAADAKLHGRNKNRAKTHCTLGHPYDETNTFMRPGNRRGCIACRRKRAMDSYVPVGPRTHCVNGHEFSEANTYRYQGRRCCRACNRVAAARVKARRLAALAVSS